MGISMNGADARCLADALKTLEAAEGKEAMLLPICVRTKDGIDERFYIDREGDRVLITPGRFYTEKRDAGDLKDFEVELSIRLHGKFTTLARNKQEAENIIGEKFSSGEIDLRELGVAEKRVNCVGEVEDGK